MPINSTSIPALRVARAVKRRRRAEGGGINYDPMSGIRIGGETSDEPAPDPQGPLSRTLSRLTGTQFGEPRYQLWPEKMVRSGATLAGDVLSGDQAVLPPGLRRQDYTDAPAPSEPTQDSTWLGRKLGLPPVQAQPNDPMMERAQDMAGLAGGQTLMTGAREAAPVAQRALVAAADSQATGAPLAALERAAEQGYTGPWYHGGERMDRFTESGKINPKRATSGPMPFFTDNPEIASNYAKGKPDTSRVAMDEGNVADYFQVLPKQLGISGRTPLSVERSWNFLPPEVKQEIHARAKRIGYENPEEASGPLTLHPEGVDATLSPSHYDWILKHEARGNPLAALREMWHDSGELIGNETALSEVYRLAGYPHQISEANAPWTEAKGVFPAMLRMHKPLQTEDATLMTGIVLPALEKAFARDRTRKNEFGSDQWDKNTRYTPREWVAQAKEDYAKGDNSFVWTSIPDKVTAELRKLGYDGILDSGGKAGGQGHRVAVPFGPEQVRSRFAKFDEKKVGESGLLKSDTVGLTSGEKSDADRNRNTGGSVNPAMNVARSIKRAKGGKVHLGPIVGHTDGRADKVPMHVPDGSYVLTSDHCSAMGEGNTLAGFQKLKKMFPKSVAAYKTAKARPAKRASGGRVPILAADGEFVVCPEDIMDRYGNLDHGHRILDHWQTTERKNHIKTLAKLAPPAQD